jgi:hypothetical protein
MRFNLVFGLRQVVHPETLDEVVAWPANSDGRWPISLADKIKCKNAKPTGPVKAAAASLGRPGQAHDLQHFRPTDDVVTLAMSDAVFQTPLIIFFYG